MSTFIVKLHEAPSGISDSYPSKQDEKKFWFVCFEIPGKWEICSCCHGEGKHAHAIDGNGLSTEMQEDPEFMEDYLAGSYDRCCEECNGAGKVIVPDEDNLNQDQKLILAQWQEEETARHEIAAAHAAERRFGC